MSGSTSSLSALTERSERLTLTDHAAISAVLLIAGDALITLQFWSLEGNPVVNALGPEGMVLVKALGSAAGLGLWFRGNISRFMVSKACVWFLFALHLFVVVTNVLVVLWVVGI